MMMKRRSIQSVFRSVPTVEGAGVHLKRVFGFRQAPSLDPFLLLDDFHSTNPADYRSGFPWHPHRGIETITYLLEGEVEHGDSMGNTGLIQPGCVQWMTAGSGIIHQEMPKGAADGSLWGFQLWANLPAADKMMAPRYREVAREDIPSVELPGGIMVRVICGRVAASRGPVRDIVIDPEYLDVTMPGDAVFTHLTKRGHTVLVYVLLGRGQFAETAAAADAEFGPETLVQYKDGDHVVIRAGSNPLRFLLISGRPLREPVAWDGPIVMNTRQELIAAFDEYRQGTFIKHR